MGSAPREPLLSVAEYWPTPSVLGGIFSSFPNRVGDVEVDELYIYSSIHKVLGQSGNCIVHPGTETEPRAISPTSIGHVTYYRLFFQVSLCNEE